MSFFRRAPTGRLLAFLAVAVAAAVAVGMGAVAAFGGGGSPPAAQPLDTAVKQALDAPSVDGVTARISFTDHLVASDVAPEGSGLGPLLSGASGRLWATSDGRLRIELQADNGDTEILLDGRTLTVYDVHANTVYKLALPQRADTSGPDSGQTHTPPTLAQIDSALAHLGEHATVSGADPSVVAGQPAYTVRLEPKTGAGLLGAAEVAWDAVRGVPLRVAIYARGDSTPTLQLEVTDISYGPVTSADVSITPPADAKVTDLGSLTSPGNDSSSQPAAPVTGLAAISAAVPFQLVAPDALGGLPREDVRLVGGQDHPAALVVYGRGLGAIVVLERATPSSTQSQKGSALDNLPTVTIAGTKAHELQASLGTVLTFDRSGVTFVVAASAAPAAVEAAAAQLG